MYRVLKVLLFLLSFLLLFSGIGVGKPPFDYSFSYVTIADGLSNNNVISLFQDHSGYVWMGTYDGLNRYDGYEFKVYRHQFEDTSSLSGNQIVCVNQDLNSNIWIGTKHGISIQSNSRKGLQLVRYVPNKEKEEKTLKIGITDIVRDKAENMFVGTEGAGVLFSEKGSFRLTQIPYGQNGNKYNQYPVRGIAISNHSVWAFIKEVGLCKLDKAQNEFKIVDTGLRVANCMQADHHGNLWIGTDDGLYRYHIASGQFTSFKKKETGLISDRVVTICIDKKQNVWIGTDGGGAAMMNSEGAFYRVTGNNDEGFPESESVYAIIEDQEGRIWIGTLRGGVVILDPNKPAFKNVRSVASGNSTLASNYITSFGEDPQGNLWIGTDGGGLSFYNKKKGRYTNFKHRSGDAHSLSNNFIADMYIDRSNNLWLATWGGGIDRYQKKQNKFKRYRTYGQWNEKNNFFVLYADHKNNLWAGSIGGGLFKYDSSKDQFLLYNHDLRNIISMYEDSSGHLWAGTFSQLIMINRNTKSYKKYDIGQAVRTICQAKKGNLWIGTEGGGLLLFNPEQGIMKRYTEKEGLPNDNVLQILKDDDGNLWMSTYQGLSKFSPSKGSFSNYFREEGIQSNQFSYNASLALRSGAFLFGGINGYTQFYPDSIVYYKTHTNVLINQIWIDGVPVNGNSRYVEEKSQNIIKTIKVPYNKANLRMKYVGINYTRTSELTYAYNIKGGEDNWINNGASRSISFPHLERGTYTLRIRAVNPSNFSRSEEVKLKIIVLPPWYGSWWAIVIYFLLITGLIFLYVTYKERRTKLKYEVRLSRMKVKKEKEINEQKLRYFTSMTHEFRTPLTLIINPLKEILDKRGTKWKVSDLTVIYDNAKRMLNLVDQLLYFRKLDKDLQLRKARIQLYPLCLQVFDSFQLLAKDKEIHYDFKCKNKAITLRCDKDKMNIILYNLLSNAFKFTGKGGTISLRVREEGKNVMMEVEDTGEGVDEKAGERIFDKFYQEDKSDSKLTHVGFGIGLHLVRQLVQKHEGEISYKSELGKGTIFYLQFPKTEKKENNFEKAMEGGAPTGREGHLEEPDEVEEINNEKDEEITLDKEEDRQEKDTGIPSTELLSSKPSMLVIEDDVEMRNYVVRIFSDEFMVHEAADGEEGLVLARQKIPDIIVSDVMMGGKDGIELCNRIKHHPALNHIPIILMTGSPSEEMRLKGVEEGADGYITKPFDKDFLTAKVASLIKNRNNQQRYFYNQVTFKKDDLNIFEEDKDLVDRCIEIVEKYCDEEDFSVKKISQEMGMSHSNLYRKMKEITGQSLNGFVRFVRLRKAAEYLISGKYNVSEASFQVGFSDSRYFRKQFKKLYGMNPSEFKKEYKEISSEKFKINKDHFH